MARIQVLGPGCERCRQLYERTQQAVRELHLDCEVDKVTDFQAIMSYGILSTPALVVDGEVRMSGRVPAVAELKEMLA
jgi:small redox-active disulfide protein 2